MQLATHTDCYKGDVYSAFVTKILSLEGSNSFRPTPLIFSPNEIKMNKT